jgi:NitT/TauT family transport system substrate-binding protein
MEHKTNNKKIVAGLIILAGILIIITSILYINLVGFSIYESKETEKTVRIGYLPILASLPLYVAQENNYFENEGIKVELIQLQSSNQLVDALVRGDIDIVVESSAAPALIVETIDPNKIKIFSTSDITSQKPFDSIIVNKDSNIRNLKDLENKKIGVFPGSTATNLLKSYLNEQGIDTSKIEFVQIVPANQLPALYSGSIDALHSYEPTTAIALESDNINLIYGSVYADQLNHNPQGVALVSTKFIKENPKLSQKVINSFNKATIFMKNNDKETRNIIVKYVKVEQNAANRVVFLYMSSSNEINENALQEYADMLYGLGELKTKVVVEDLIYNP